MEERFIYKTIKEAKVDYVLKGWSIELDREDAVVVSKQKTISHILHAILTLATGFWGIVWIVIYLTKSSERHIITFDKETKFVNIQAYD